MTQFSANRVLPRDVVIPSVDDLLYEIGLCLTSVRERPKRRAIDNPIVIAMFSWLYLIQRIITIFVSDHAYLVILCDVGHYLGFKTLFNFSLINAGFMTIKTIIIKLKLK